MIPFNKKKYLWLKPVMIGMLLISLIHTKAQAQAELEPWGNLNGIRLKGQLLPFSSRITLAGKNWHHIKSTGKERQHPKYSRSGDIQTVVTQIDKFNITEIVKSNKHGFAEITIRCVPSVDTVIKGIYLEVTLPQGISAGSFKLLNVPEQYPPLLQAGEQGDYLHSYAGGIRFKTGDQKFSIKSTTPSPITIRPDSITELKNLHAYFPVCSGTMIKDQVYQAVFALKIKDKIDHKDAEIRLDTTVQGRQFVGFGGNFRLQNPKGDPQVIDYCLKHMRVAWGRVEMPWRNWQPDININPIEKARKGGLNNHVKESMEMAQRLGKMHMPLIVSAWSPPGWAVEGKLNNGKSPEGIWGNPLKEEAMPQIYRSITDYILYLRDNYGVEADYFSFNESDLGINVRQTPAQHNELIKGLGAYFASAGLKTKLLLGDNSDATTYSFIDAAMDDPAARPYIGAISFHSWRGWDTPVLQKWAAAAERLQLPLIVGEGSIDAAAWAYPAYFLEQSYALAEISLYLRLLSICQPAAILQWQLTADYSPLSGGGIFSDNGPLRPTQRFWNLKQFASTPPNLYAIPLFSSHNAIVGAALGDSARHVYTVHLVNNGAARKLRLQGLPSEVKSLNLFITDKKRSMQQMQMVKVNNHQALIKIDALCYITLVSTNQQ